MTYKELYFFLYGQMADALEYLNQGNFIMGIYTLEQAHIKAEEMAIETDIISDFP